MFLEEQDKIWARLYRGDKSRAQRGLGLGLSLVRAIVQAHGGRIELESQVGRGTTFRIWLPLHERKPRLLEAPMQEP